MMNNESDWPRIFAAVAAAAPCYLWRKRVLQGTLAVCIAGTVAACGQMGDEDDFYENEGLYEDLTPSFDDEPYEEIEVYVDDDDDV